MKGEVVLKKFILLMMLIILSIALFADPNEDIEDGTDSTIPPTTIQNQTI